MSETGDLIRHHFTKIDDDIYDYIYNVLDDGKDDFQNGEEIFECLGEVFLNVTEGNKNEDEIKDICDQLLKSLKR